MLNIFAKQIKLIFWLGLLSSSFVHAEVRNYQYDGNLPFVQMMLNMMVTMGILDRVPVNGIYNRQYMSSPYRTMNNRYGNRNWNNTLADTAWGRPRWGVLSDDSYSLSYGPSNLDGWVNEPWEMSVWNNRKQNNQAENFEEPAQQNVVNKQVDNQVEENLTAEQLPELKQKACVTEFCGLQTPNLNGLWVSREGEMLGVKNSSYLWSDGRLRHLTGNIKLQNDYFLVSADGYDQLMRFKYKLDGNYLLTMQPDGLVREFKRVSNGQVY